MVLRRFVFTPDSAKSGRETYQGSEGFLEERPDVGRCFGLRPGGRMGKARLFGLNGLKRGIANRLVSAMFVKMSTVQEIEAAIPRLPRSEVEKLREWIDNY